MPTSGRPEDAPWPIEMPEMQDDLDSYVLEISTATFERWSNVKLHADADERIVAALLGRADREVQERRSLARMISEYVRAERALSRYLEQRRELADNYIFRLNVN